MKKPAQTQVPIHDLIASRWSRRAYDAGKPVGAEAIISMLEAARWAPSCFGDQPWRFVVCDKTTNPDAWQRAFDTLAPSNQVWVKNAPLLVLVAADTVFTLNSNPNRWAQYDTGAAAENLSLQAEALGLIVHQLGGFDPEKARQALQVPEQYTLMAMIAIGHPTEIDNLPPDLHAREIAPRQRRALGELCFTGQWGTPIV